MSNDSFTLGAMIDDIFTSYKRTRPDIRERLPNRLSYHISRLATRYPFWFLKVEPGAIAPGLFPFANPPVYTEYAEGSWIDIGWMHSIVGQRDYYFSLPDNEAFVTDPARWSRCHVQNLESVFEYQLTGGYPREIQVCQAHEVLRRSDFSQTGEPQQVCLITQNEQSFLRFNMKHDQNIYLYAVSFVRKDFPVFKDASDTNPIFRYHPEFVRIIGCMAVAEMFRDFEAFQAYENMLEGSVDPATGRRSPGLIDQMISDTRRRWGSQDDVMEHYSSPPQRARTDIRPSPTGGIYYDYWGGGY